MLVFRKILILSYFLFAPVIAFEMMGFITRYRGGLFSFFATPTAFRVQRQRRRFRNLSKRFRFTECHSLFSHRFAEKNVRVHLLSGDFGRQGVVGRPRPYLREYIKCIARRTDPRPADRCYGHYRSQKERGKKRTRVGRTINERGPNNSEKKCKRIVSDKGWSLLRLRVCNAMFSSEILLLILFCLLYFMSLAMKNTTTRFTLNLLSKFQIF